MKQCAIICGVLFCTAISFVYLRCSNDTLFNENKQQWSAPFAFVSGSEHPVVTLNDPTVFGLTDTITVVQNADVWFIGLVSNPRPHLNVKATWRYGDGHADPSMYVDSSYIIKHTFTAAGRYVGHFTIADSLGDSAVDSVTVKVVNSGTETVTVELLSPVNKSMNVDPAVTGGVHFSWKITKSDPADTVTSDVYLGVDSSALAAIATGLKTTSVDSIPLGYDTTYYWRVVVKRPSGVAFSSAVYAFSTMSNPFAPGPVIESIRSDTTVTVKDSLLFFANIQDSGAGIAQYAWDFDGNGTFDDSSYSSSTTDTSRHAYANTGIYNAVLRVTDQNLKKALDTVTVTVVPAVSPGGGPVIWNIRHDTTVTVLDSLDFFADVTPDSTAAIARYMWNFGDLTPDHINSTTPAIRYAYTRTGTFNAVFRVIDGNGKTASSVVTITVSPIKLHPAYVSPVVDTVDYGAFVRCTVSVTNRVDNLSFEIDTLQTGFIPMTATGSSAVYTFKMDTAAIIDTVKIRVFSPLTDTLAVQLRIFVRPRGLTITGIDSTFSTIIVHWTQTLESAFQEYLIYSAPTDAVDTNGTLWASINQAKTLSYTTSVASYTSAPRYYRLYQRDKNGLLSPGSKVVFGNIKNSPPAAPVFVNPSKSNDTVWSNAVVRWNRSVDLNGDAVSYELLYNRGSGYVPYATGITDTFVALTGFDTLSFRANLMVIARDSNAASDSSELTNVFFKQVRSGRMFFVPKGSFKDSSNNVATITYDFLMDSMEVTQLSYKTLMNGTNPSSSIDNNQPVETITWYQAIRYCNAASKALNLDTAYTFTSISSISATGLQCNLNVKAVRLPTEDEWELAAHGGKNYIYATDDGTLSCTKVNYNGPCPAPVRPAIAGSYPPNPYNLHEMTGNVAEWCWDVFSSQRPNGRVDYDASLAVGGVSMRVQRGGDFQEANTGLLQTNSRSRALPATASPLVGFRCVIPIKQ